MKKMLVIVGLLLITLSGNAFAWSGKADIEGSPGKLTLGIQSGYFIWQDEGGFHIWTTAHDEKHVFTGTIRTDGDFFQVKGHRLESGDSFRVADNPWFRDDDNGRRHFQNKGRLLNLDKDKLQFKLETTRGSDGINFNIRGASYIDFDLYMDGKPVSRKDIRISDIGWHPEAHHFRLYK